MKFLAYQARLTVGCTVKNQHTPHVRVPIYLHEVRYAQDCEVHPRAVKPPTTLALKNAYDARIGCQQTALIAERSTTHVTKDRS